MIRFTWLQFRAQATVAISALAIIAVVLAVTGPHLSHLYDTTVAPCKAQGDCAAATSALLGNDRPLQEGLAQIILIVPALTGILWGAPLAARELEAGTLRLAWTQSVTPMRWLVVKLGLVGLASMAVAGLASLMATWWAGPFDRAMPMPFTVFGERGVVPVGYAGFGFVLGVTAGLLIRRTLPAMAITLAAFVAARAAVTELRPHLEAPITVTERLPATVKAAILRPGGAAAPHPGDWVLSSNTLNGTARPWTITVKPVTATFDPTTLSCHVLGPAEPGPSVGGTAWRQATQEASNACGAHARAYVAQLREVVTYQPASRYWPFQAYETAIFLVLAVILAAVCFWWIRRRRLS